MEEKNIKINDVDAEVKQNPQNDKNKNGAQTADKKADNDSNAKAKADNADNKQEKEGADSKKADNADVKDDTAKQLEDAKKQIAELKDKYIRTVAEFDNFRRRTNKEKAELILNGGEKAVVALLPVVDDFERALADENKEDAEAIKKGFELIHKKILKAFEGLGVKRIDTADKDFDTDVMEAIAMVPGVADDKKGKVVDCVQAGYTMNDKVIRHAKVAVGQ